MRQAGASRNLLSGQRIPGRESRPANPTGAAISRPEHGSYGPRARRRGDLGRTGDPRHGTHSLHLAMRVTVDSEGDKSYTRTGFERLTNAEHVMQLVPDIQAKASLAKALPARSQPDTDPG